MAGTKEHLIYKQIMSRCKGERIKSGLKIRELAKRLEVTEGYVSALESGRASPSNELFMKYLIELGIDTDVLVDSLRITKGSHVTDTQELFQKIHKSISEFDEDWDSLLLLNELVSGIKNFKKLSINKRLKSR